MAEETNSGSLAPPSEEVHLPEPSYLPVLVALGITVTLIGVILTWVIVAIGLIITVVSLARWIRLTRAEMAELPLEH